MKHKIKLPSIVLCHLGADNKFAFGVCIGETNTNIYKQSLGGFEKTQNFLAVLGAAPFPPKDLLNWAPHSFPRKSFAVVDSHIEAFEVFDSYQRCLEILALTGKEESCEILD